MSEIKNKFLRQSIFSDGICQDADSVWFISVKNNLLVKMSIESAKITDCRWIPTESDKKIPYRYLFSKNKVLYILPYNDDHLCIYDIEKDEFTRVSIPQEQKEGKSYFHFTGALFVNDKIYMYGWDSIVAIYDIEDQEFDFIDLKKYISREEQEIIQIEGFVYKQTITFVLSGVWGYVVYDCDQKHGKFHAIPEDGDTKIDNIFVDSEGIFYSPRCDQEILKCYKFESDKVDEILVGEKRDRFHKSFGYVYSYDNKVFILPGQNKRMYIVEDGMKKTIEFGECSDFDERIIAFPYEYIIRNAYVTPDKHIIAIDAWNMLLIDFDMADNSLKKTRIEMADDIDWYELCRHVNRKNNFCNEWHEESLKAFVDELLL